MVTLPSYEGDMSVLKNHISIITFLRPGKIKVKKNDENIDEFFVEDGIVEYFNDSLVVLSVSALNVKDLSKEFLDNLSKDTQDKLTQKDISDHERYILNHKLDALKEIRV
jgi:F0F1-type ATP synthase epsilon subunit